MTKLTFLGDVMCEAEMISAYKIGNVYNFDSIFERMKEYFNQSDYVLANLETPISFNNEGLTSEKYKFNSPYEFAQSVFNSGIKFVATANNHCLDRGTEGVKSTVQSLDKIGFKHTGIFYDTKRESLTIDVNGIRFGMLSYTYGTNAFSNNVYLKRKNRYMVNMFQDHELSNPIFRYAFKKRYKITGRIVRKLTKYFKSAQYQKHVYERKENDKRQIKQLLEDIKSLKETGVDFIIMYMHSGGQYNAEPTEYTKNLTQFLLNNGVDIVAGSHEHVVHGGVFSDINNNRLATYSLGNFNGIIGIYEEPFDKMSEYSVAWNIYFDESEKNILKTTFSVLKTIELPEKKIQTVPVYDLIISNHENAQENLIADTLKIAQIFSGKEYDNVQQEFLI